MIYCNTPLVTNHHIYLLNQYWISNFKILTSEVYLPNIFISTVGDEIKGWEVAVYGQQVQTQQHHQHLNDDPHEGSAGTQSENLWAKPLHKHSAHFLFNLFKIKIFSVSHRINYISKNCSPFLNAERHSSK